MASGVRSQSQLLLSRVGKHRDSASRARSNIVFSLNPTDLLPPVEQSHVSRHAAEIVPDVGLAEVEIAIDIAIQHLNHTG